MFSFDEIGEILDEVAEEVPEQFFERLNGGVSLLPETRLHPEDVAGNLYTLGEYHHDQMGRYIYIYYGSLTQTFPQLDRDGMRAELRRVLFHEFTHHLESLAGERGLEYKDAMDVAEYKREWGEE